MKISKIAPLPWCVPNLGSDPEIGILRNGKPYPADRIFKYQRQYKKEGILTSYYADGFFLELSPAPSSCRESAVTHIARAMFCAITKLNKSDTLVAEPTLSTPKEIMDLAGPDSIKSGCKPDLDAWRDGEQNIPMGGFAEYPYRHGGGHIHLGFTDYTRKAFRCKKNFYEFIRLMDYIVGNVFVVIDKDNNLQRRELVKAGCYRIPSHGVEYRVLSNVLILHPAIYSAFLGLSRAALAIYRAGYANAIFELVDSKDIIQAINTCDKGLAYRNWKKIRATLCALTGNNDQKLPCSALFGGGCSGISSFELMLNGKITFKDDLIKNWTFDFSGDAGFFSYCRRNADVKEAKKIYDEIREEMSHV